jgi:hypothetical protein
MKNVSLKINEKIVTFARQIFSHLQNTILISPSRYSMTNATAAAKYVKCVEK